MTILHDFKCVGKEEKNMKMKRETDGNLWGVGAGGWEYKENCYEEENIEKRRCGCGWGTRRRSSGQEENEK